MSYEHAPEPWYKNKQGNLCGGGYMVCETVYRDEDLERIIACVNACEGIPTEELNWVSVKDRLPTRDDKYFVYCPSADEDSPLIAMAWFDPNGFGWSLLPKDWIEAITHWRSIPRNVP